MSSRRASISFAFASMILTVWSASRGVPAEPPDHRPPHRKHHPAIRPARPIESEDRTPPATTGPAAKMPEDGKGNTVVFDRKDRDDAMRRGEWVNGQRKAAPGGERDRAVRFAHPGGRDRDGGGRTDAVSGGSSSRHGDRSPSPASGRGKAAVARARPNMLVLLLDDQDDNTPYWEAMPRTAAMVQDGLRFRNAFAPTPVCSPGRCTFLTGRLAHNTGVYTLSGPHGPIAFVGQPSTEFSVGLARLGYINGYFGKTWGSDAPNPGWGRWCAIGGNNMYTGYGYDVTDFTVGKRAGYYKSGEYVTDFLSSKAAEFVEKGIPDGQPFFICLAPTAPHLPLPPAPRDVDYAKRRWGDRLPKRPNFNERDVSDKSSWLRDTAFVRSECVPYAVQEYHKRMGSLMAVDRMMGRLQDLLRAQGKWDNTVVVVTSDNGYNLGAHRLIHKMAPYEESIHVPLYAAGPGVAPGEITRMVGLHDLAPTFLDLAGGQAPPNMDGKSLRPFLASGSDSAAPDWRTVLLTEYDTGGDHPGFNPGGAMRIGWELDIPTYRSVRTDTSKYILWTATGEEEVYDLIRDPYELTNLTRTDAGAAAPLLARLRPMLVAVKGCVGGGCP